MLKFDGFSDYAGEYQFLRYDWLCRSIVFSALVNGLRLGDHGGTACRAGPTRAVDRNSLLQAG